MRYGKNLAGIGGLYRSAVQDAHALAVRKARREFFPDKRVHGPDIFCRRCLSGADGPDGFIGDNRILHGRTVGKRRCKLRCHDLVLAAGFPLGFRFSDTNDGDQAVCIGRNRLVMHLRIGFLVILPALGMAEDDILGPDIMEHGGGDITRKSPVRFLGTILRAQPHGFQVAFHRRNMHERRADDEIAPGGEAVLRRDPCLHIVDQGGGHGQRSVHLPVSGDQFFHRIILIFP